MEKLRFIGILRIQKSMVKNYKNSVILHLKDGLPSRRISFMEITVHQKNVFEMNVIIDHYFLNLYELFGNKI